MDVRFVILAAPGKHRAVTKRLPILVGRSEEARLRITQDCVSRRHCEFVEKQGRVCVRDLGSTNGTLLDEEEIAADVMIPVPSGSVVKVGGVSLRVEYGSAEQVAETQPAAEGDTVPLTAESPPPAEDAVADESPEEAAAAELPGWPSAADPPVPDGGDLDDFFKSLK